jgi:hypothetical protein
MDAMSDPTDVTADLKAFLTWWYGPPAVQPVVMKARAPYSLRHWYACAGAWSQPLTYQNFVRPLEELVTEDGATVFYDENQAVCAWGYGAGGDAEVHYRENYPRGTWQQVGERLSTFLRHVAVFEAVFSGRASRSLGDAPQVLISHCLAQFQLAPFIAWQWPSPDTRLYIGESMVALSGPNVRRAGPVEEVANGYIFMAGKSDEALAAFDEPGLVWDGDSRSSGPW